MLRESSLAIAGFSILAGLAPAVAAPAAPAYHIVKTVPLGAPDKWDYVEFDAGSGRVFVSHGDRLTVLDGKSGAILGNVEGMPGGTHGIGISAATGKGYTDDGKAGQAVAFDLKSFKTGARIAAKDDADGIAVDPTSGHIFVVDGDSATLTVIDPKTDKAIANIATGGGMEFAVSGNNGKIYVNGADKKEIVRIDTATNKIDARWPIPGCTSPHGLAVDTAAHRLFPTCKNGVLTVVNTDSGAVVATLPIGQGTDGAAFDPKRKLVFSSNSDGTLSVIHEKDADHFEALGSIKTQVTGKNMGIDQATGRLYVVAGDVEPSPAGPNGAAAKPKLVPGSVKLLFLDPDSAQ
jgi:YVTN family beta-propeller protein